MKKHFSVIHELSRDQGNKGLMRQLLEIFLLYSVSKLGPGFYILSKMYGKSVGLGEVTGYASVASYNKRVFALNDRLYHKCSQNKAIEKAILGTYRIPTPTLIGWFHPVSGRDVAGNRLRNAHDVKQLLDNLNVGDKVCFKLVESWGGTGFSGCEYRGNETVLDLNGGSEESSRDFANKRVASGKDGLVIEELISQHDEYSRFNASSVNTLRVVVMNRGQDRLHTVLAFLRVGRAGSLIDNASAGSFIFPIDLNTGRLGPGYQKHNPTRLYAVHPDSKCTIAGSVTPFLDDAIDLAQESVRVFPGINFAGVDIGFSREGPLVLELNIWPDYSGFAHTSTPSRAALAGTA